MEFHDAQMKRTLGRTTKVLFHSLFFMVVCIYQTAEGKALSQTSDLVPPNKPMIYIDIARWEDRTAYPRFLIYRDHFRRQLETRDSSNNEDQSISSYSKSTNLKNSSDDDNSNESAISKDSVISSKKEPEHIEHDTELSSLEQLLAEHRNNGVIPSMSVKTDNANNVPHPPTPQNANNYADTSASTEIDKHVVINFPKDKTNPCNRLQINPDDQKQENGSSNESTKGTNSTRQASAEEDVSFEIGNRENFSNGHSKEVDAEGATAELIRDVVPTFQLTMKIIEQSNWDDENVVFSPLSIANVLSMLLLGAEGETFKELSMQLEKNLAPSLDSPSLRKHRYHEVFKILLQYLKVTSGNGVMLNSASEIFVDDSFPVNRKFKNELLNFYDAQLEAINFRKDGYIFVNKINKWVQEKTQNQIQTILDEPPSPDLTMGIINAIYFKGPWENPFSNKLTRIRDFRVQPKEKIKAQLMINILEIPYIERDSYRMTAVPYMGNKTALFLILPKGTDGINDLKRVERSLSRQELNESIALMKETKIALTLPKLKYSSDGEMVRILQNMGLSSLFDANKANFSAISPQGLYISKLLHRAVVEINEKGTEASAVTLGTADRIIDDIPIPFGCDKPFLFFIYHINADTILFWGRVVRPVNEHGVS